MSVRIQLLYALYRSHNDERGKYPQRIDMHPDVLTMLRAECKSDILYFDEKVAHFYGMPIKETLTGARLSIITHSGDTRVVELPA